MASGRLPVVTTIVLSLMLLVPGSVAAAPACGVNREQVVVVFGNGIQTIDKKAQDTAALLRATVKVSLDPAFPRECLAQAYAYASTVNLADDLIEAASQVLGDNYELFMKIFLNSVPAPKWFQDFLSGVLSSRGLPDYVTDTDLQTQVAQYVRRLSNGQTVIVVAHSQGNLYANRSYEALFGEGSGLDSSLFHIVPIASPDSFVADRSAPEHITLIEDLVAARVFPIINRFALQPNLSNILVGYLPDCVPSLKQVIHDLQSAWDCHNFIDSYLRGVNSGPLLVKHVTDIINAVAPNRRPNAYLTATDGHVTKTAGETLTTQARNDGGASVTFSASQSSDDDGFISTWHWAVDNAPLETMVPTLQRNLSVGRHFVALSLDDNFGATSAVVGMAVMVDPAPMEAPPAAVDDRYVMTQGGTLMVDAPGVLGNDLFPPDAIVEFLPTLGGHDIRSAPPFRGGFTLDLSTDQMFLGELSFQYVIHAASGDSNVATVNVRVSRPIVPPYAIVDLGALPGYQSSCGQAINAFGQVTGVLSSASPGNSTYRGFLYTPDAPLADVGVLLGDYGSAGRALNDLGDVTGYSSHDVGVNGSLAGTPHAFVFTIGAGMRDLGTFARHDHDFAYSAGYGINNAGRVTGFSGSWLGPTQGGFPTHAFLYTPETGVMSDLGALATFANTVGFNTYSYGMGINNSDQVVGSSYVGTVNGPRSHAFLYTPGVGMKDLGTLGGDYSEGWGLNASGQVTGISNAVTDGSGHAFLYKPSTQTMTDLGTLGGDYSIGYGINGVGQVVGVSNVTAGAGSKPFLYTPTTGMIDMASLLPSGSGWQLTSAFGINDAGQITGCGENGLHGSSHAFTLSPVIVP